MSNNKVVTKEDRMLVEEVQTFLHEWFVLKKYNSEQFEQKNEQLREKIRAHADKYEWVVLPRGREFWYVLEGWEDADEDEEE